MSELLRGKNPYVGPRAFETGETLYGRARETRELLHVLIAERIVLLHSPSGAGKSSLIQAALVPSLTEENFRVLPTIRVNGRPPDKVPADVFNRYIFSTLRYLESAVPADQQMPLETLSGMRLPDYLDQRFGPSTDVPDSTVLIFDQFEEIVSLDPTDQGAKMEFFAQVGQALRDRRRWALFALRGDYKAAIESYARPIPTRLENAFSLGLLGPEAAREAIREPARHAGVDFLDHAAQKLVDDLRTMHLQQEDGSFKEQPGPNVEPVQLQVVCFRLWQQLPPDATQITDADLQSAGDVDDALAGYYADAVQIVSENTGVRKRFIRAWFEDKLITPQGMRSQVLLEQERSGGLDNDAIDLLKDAYLVRADKRSGSTWYELAHDRLIAPIRENNAGWFKTNLSPLQQQADLWRRAGKPPTTMLLRGIDLDKAEKWAEEHDAELTNEDRELLHASLDARQRDRDIAALEERQRQLEAAEQLAAVERERAESERRLAEAEWQRAEEQRKAAEQLAAAERQRAETERQRAEAERLRAEEQTQAARRLRVRTRVIQTLGIAAILLSILAIAGFIFAGNQARVATDNSNTALRAQATAEAAQAIAETARATAEAATQEEKIASAKVKSLLDAANLKAESVRLAGYANHATQSDLALLLSLEAMRVTETVEAKTSLLEGLMRNFHLVSRLHGPADSVYSAAFSPDGKTVAVAGRDGVYLWDVATGTRITESLKSGVIDSIAFSPDGRQLAVKDDSGGMSLWEWTNGARRALQKPAPDLSLQLDWRNLAAFSPDGQLLATSGSDSKSGGSAIFVWDTMSGQLLSSTLTYTPTSVSRLAFNPDNKALAAGYSDGEIVLWDLASGKRLLFTQGTGTSHITMLKFTQYDSPQAYLVSADDRGKLIWLDSRSGAKIYEQDTGVANTDADWSVKTSQVVFVDQDQESDRLTLWNSDGRSTTLAGHAAPVTSLALSSDGQLLVSGDKTGQVVLWRTSGNALSTPLLHEGAAPVIGAAYRQAPDRNTLVSVNNDQIMLWKNTAGGTLTVTTAISLATSSATAMALSPDGKTLALGLESGYISLWDLNQHRQITEALTHTDRVTGLAFSPNGREFISISADGNLLKSDATDGQPLEKLHLDPLKTQYPNAAAFSPAGDRLVVGYSDGSVALLDPASLAVQDEFDKLHDDPISRIAFNSAGNFATGSKSAIKLWSSASISPTVIGLVSRGSSSTDELTSLAYSPDNKTLVEGTASGAIILWDVTDAAHPQRIAALPSHSEPVTTLTFSQDGQSLISGGSDTGLQLWPMQPDKWRAAACRVAARNFTWIEWTSYFPSDTAYHATCSDEPVNIVADFLQAAQQNVQLKNLAQVKLWFARALEWSASSQDFDTIEPVCEFGILNELQPDAAPVCARAVVLSAKSTNYHQLYNACQFGSLHGWQEMALSACTRAGELSATADDYAQPYSFCEFGVQNNLGTSIIMPACARAAELSVKSDDYDQMFDTCALGSFFKLQIDFTTACHGAARQAPTQAYEAYFYALAGERDRSIDLFTKAEQNARTDDATQNNNLCWRGGLTGSAEIAHIVLPACDRGVNLAAKEEQPPNRDSRGMARALTGDIPRAIEDFQSLVDWLKTENAASQFGPETVNLYSKERLSFIKALQAGQNPFDNKTLYMIRHE